MVKRVAGHPRDRRSDRAERPPAKPRSTLSKWVTRITATILSLGALAGAITAILALRPTPDPEDTAALAAIRVAPEVPFDEYVRRLEGSGIQKFRAGPGPVPRDAPTTSSERTKPSKPTSTTSTAKRPTSTPATSTSVTTPTSPTAVSALGGLVPPPAVNPEDVQVATGQVVDTLPRLCPSEDSPGCRRILFALAIGSSVDPEGNPVPPQQAAERVLQVLKDARTTSEGPVQERQPLGAVVTVDVELTGLRGKPVELTWSMWQTGDGARLHGDWLNTNLAYRLEAATDHDTTSVDLWVPLPSQTGPYVIRVDLTTEGSRLASGTSDPFD